MPEIYGDERGASKTATAIFPDLTGDGLPEVVRVDGGLSVVGYPYFSEDETTFPIDVGGGGAGSLVASRAGPSAPLDVIADTADGIAVFENDGSRGGDLLEVVLPRHGPKAARLAP